MTADSGYAPARRLHGDGEICVNLYRGDRPPTVWGTLPQDDPPRAFSHHDYWIRSIVRHIPGHSGGWLIAETGGRALGGVPLVESRKGPFRRFSAHYMGTPGYPLLPASLDLPVRGRVVAGLCRALRRLSRGGGTLDLNLFMPADHSVFWRRELSRCGARHRDVSHSAIPLDGGIETVEQRHFHRTRRKERNRALRAGCEAGVTSDPQIVDAYYPVYLAATRRWGVDPLPSPFFRSLLEQGGGRAFMSWVRFEGRLIGAHLNLEGDRDVTAWNGATLPEHNDKHPATLLIWTDLEEACRRGSSCLDLGSHGGLAGVANFKKLFGAEDRFRSRYTLSSTAGRLLGGLSRRLRGRSD